MNNENNEKSQNKSQSFWNLKNVNLRKEMMNFVQNEDSKPKKNCKKVKYKKAIIRKFKEIEYRNNIPKTRNKNSHKKQLNGIQDIPLDQYKKYLNALFYDNNDNTQNDSYPKKNIKNIYINTSPLNNNSIHKKTYNNFHDYLLDSTDNLEISPTSKNTRKSNGKKNKKRKNRSNEKNTNTNNNNNYYYVNTLSGSDSSVRKEKKKRYNGSKIKKFNMTKDDYYDEQDSDDDIYEKIMYGNNKLNNVNRSVSLKKKHNHKRIKSCFDPEKIDKNGNEGFYKIGNNNSLNLLNKTTNKKKNKLEMHSSEKKNKKKNNSLSKKNFPKGTKESMTSSDKKNKTRNNNNTNSDNISLVELKNKLKDKLISVTHELQYDLKLYNGPINIDCISLKNVDDSMNDMMNTMIINGYDCIRNKEYIIKCNKGKKCVDIELVKIKGNLLYFLIKKS